MENDETKAAQAVDHHGLVGRLLKMLDYVLDKDDSEELKLEITISGANWETDEDDEIGEYPPTLTDTVPLVIEESSTTDELCSETFDREELEDIRRRLSANTEVRQPETKPKTQADQ